VSSLPRFDAATLEKMFNTNMQDMLMLVYLGNLARTQLKALRKNL
jgi:translation initiation factor 3 subunit F